MEEEEKIVVIDNISAWLGFGIGVGTMIILWIITLKFKKRKQYNMAIFKRLIFDAGSYQLKAYENIKELEKAFQDIEGGGK